MRRDERSWAEMVYEYNMPEQYDYVTTKSKSPNINLRYCPTCKSVFELRYEQKYKGTVVYNYSQLKRGLKIKWEKSTEECGGRGCSGNKTVLEY